LCPQHRCAIAYVRNDRAFWPYHRRRQRRCIVARPSPCATAAGVDVFSYLADPLRNHAIVKSSKRIPIAEMARN
jgi:hypothetical protein